MKCSKQQRVYKLLRVPCYVVDESRNTKTFFLLFAIDISSSVWLLQSIKTGIV